MSENRFRKVYTRSYTHTHTQANKQANKQTMITTVGTHLRDHSDAMVAILKHKCLYVWRMRERQRRQRQLAEKES